MRPLGDFDEDEGPPVNIEDLPSGSVAGVALCGWKLPDGRILLGPDREDPLSLRGDQTVGNWPKLLRVAGIIYTFEGDNSDTSPNGFLNAEYM
jgi:hypothetical protein